MKTATINGKKLTVFSWGGLDVVGLAELGVQLGRSKGYGNYLANQDGQSDLAETLSGESMVNFLAENQDAGFSDGRRAPGRLAVMAFGGLEAIAKKRGYKLTAPVDPDRAPGGSGRDSDRLTRALTAALEVHRDIKLKSWARNQGAEVRYVNAAAARLVRRGVAHYRAGKGRVVWTGKAETVAEVSEPINIPLTRRNTRDMSSVELLRKELANEREKKLQADINEKQTHKALEAALDKLKASNILNTKLSHENDSLERSVSHYKEQYAAHELNMADLKTENRVLGESVAALSQVCVELEERQAGPGGDSKMKNAERAFYAVNKLSQLPEGEARDFWRTWCHAELGVTLP